MARGNRGASRGVAARTKALDRANPRHDQAASPAPKPWDRRLGTGRKLGLERRLGTRIVTYADDLVILCREGNADAALQRLREITGKLKLTVNGEKTRICKVPEASSASWDTRRVDVFGENRPGPPAAIKEEHQAHGRESPRADQPIGYLAKHHRAGGSVEPRTARVSQLLQRWYRQQSISRARQLHGCAVASNGCVPSTKSGDAGAGAILSRTSTGISGSHA